MPYFYKGLVIFFFSLFITACISGSGSSGTIPSKAGELISMTKLSTHTVNEIIATLDNSSGLIAPFYDVDTYKVIYKTRDTKGELINVSGLLTVPKKNAGTPSPRISLHHGTIFLDQYAPSFNHQANTESVIAASIGYIVTQADYIGYGESAGLTHPHTHKDTLSGAAIDLLRASKTWLMQQNIADNGQLFLGGYSEGGYTTYAVQKRIQEELSDEFTVTASVPSEAAYNITLTSQISPDDSLYSFLFYSYILKAYNEIYTLNILPEIIRSEYYNVVNNYFDGRYSAAEISALLPPANSFADNFFNGDFLEKFNQGEVPQLSERFAENSLHNWIPNAPTRFFHGRDDKIVPFEPVAQLAQDLKNKGAKDIELVECYAGENIATTHQNCFFPAMIYSIEFFAQFAKDL